MTDSILQMILATVAIGSAGLWWWFRRRDRSYSYAPRAALLSQAIQDGNDVRLVYWSKTQRRFRKLEVTPQSLDEQLLTGNDHTSNTTRLFKVARIKSVAVIPNPALVRLKGRTVRCYTEFMGETPLMLAALLAVAALIQQQWMVRRRQFDVPLDKPRYFQSPALSLPESNTNRVPALSVTTARAPVLGTNRRATGDEPRIEPTPRNSTGFLNRAKTRAGQGDTKGSIADCSEALTLDPFYVDAYYLRGLQRVVSGNATGAVADCSRAVELNPLHAPAYLIRGLAKHLQGDFAGAVDDFNNVIRLNPTDAQAFNARAWSRYRKGEIDAARPDVEKAVTLRPDMPDVYDTRAWIRFARQDIAGATKDCNHVIELAPQSAIANSAQGLLYYMAKEYDRAASEWTKAITVSPTLKPDLAPWIAQAEAAGKTKTPVAPANNR